MEHSICSAALPHDRYLIDRLATQVRLDSKKAESLALVEGRIQEKEGEVQRLYSAIQQASEKPAFEKVRQLSDQLAETQAALEQYMEEWEKLAR